VGGGGFGGGIKNIARNTFTATLTVSDSRLADNRATGGTGGLGGDGGGGGIFSVGSGFGTPGLAILTVSHSTLRDNRATGGAGDLGGDGQGGGIVTDAHAILTLTDSRITRNEADGGSGGGGGCDGQGIDGGLYLAAGGSACLDAFTQAHVKHNHASTSDDDVFGVFTTCP
jgi:hypothetical protein